MKKHSTTAKEFRKPRANFPLFPHRRGHWAKKVRGEMKYFGRCDQDAQGKQALQKWLDEKEDLLAGRDPRSKTGGIGVFELCNAFLNAKLDALKAQEIAALTFEDIAGRLTALSRRLVSGELSATWPCQNLQLYAVRWQRLLGR